MGQSPCRRRAAVGLLGVLMICLGTKASGNGSPAAADWATFLQAARQAHAEKPSDLALAAAMQFPMETDWLLQDCGGTLEPWMKLAPGDDPLGTPWMDAVRGGLSAAAQRAFAQRADLLRHGDPAPTAEDWLRLYAEACQLRRAERLGRLAATHPRVVFGRRRPESPSFFAYTEGLSDAQHERHFRPGSELCLLHLGTDGQTRTETLLQSPEGVIRDADVSHDASRIVFAWKRADRTDDYHLYERDMASGHLRQLTFGLGFADYEPAYLPSGDIVFSSTRCVQTVDCWWTEVSNLYICGPDGVGLRRVGFDQVHTICPQVLEDGTVIYTRWDYNDRGQIWPQGLFRMNQDGTGQAELYGNSSYFPTTIAHARGIPGTQRLLAVAMGHHTWQAGKLIAIDPAKGRQENEGVTMLAPVRPADPVRVDAYGQQGDLFRQPYPLGETDFLVCFVPAALNRARSSAFGLYWMDADGRRELLAPPGSSSCDRPVPLTPRPVPPRRPAVVDYRKREGFFYLQDVHQGPGLEGVPRGVVRSLRVVALDFRAAGVQNNTNRGPAGGALVSTPIAVPNGSWDVKRILGDAQVHADGSAFFVVPARTPVYFQALDAKGQAVQTMRSWATLQPGETQSCVGCHEHKNTTPPAAHGVSLAMRLGPEALRPFHGPPRGFSYVKEVQPIWDKHCIGCHAGRPDRGFTITPSASHCHSGDATGAICDGLLPRSSDDHGIPRHTWWSRKGGTEWVQLDFNLPQTVGICQVYWFDDGPRGGGCRVPQAWRLLVPHGDGWREVSDASGYGVATDAFNTVRFAPVTTAALRLEVQLQTGFSGGVLEWLWGHDEASIAKLRKPAVDLRGAQSAGPGGRRWSASYLYLTRSGSGSEWVNWVSAQSVPTMLPPYHAGAAKSRLPELLRSGHRGASLTPEEHDRVSAWIDLLVPFCGDYTEAHAWTEADVRKYEHFLRKRRRMEQIEARHIERLTRQQTGEPWQLDAGFTNVALNPFAASDTPGYLPSAEASSVREDKTWFAAAAVVDGRTENTAHGPDFPAWVPQNADGAWLRIHLAEATPVREIRLWTCLGAPDGAAWKAGTLEFSDGSRLPFTLDGGADPLIVVFPERTVEWLRLADLQPAIPGQPGGISEIEVWGLRRPQ